MQKFRSFNANELSCSNRTYGSQPYIIWALILPRDPQAWTLIPSDFKTVRVLPVPGGPFTELGHKAFTHYISSMVFFGLYAVRGRDGPVVRWYPGLFRFNFMLCHRFPQWHWVSCLVSLPRFFICRMGIIALFYLWGCCEENILNIVRHSGTIVMTATYVPKSGN